MRMRTGIQAVLGGALVCVAATTPMSAQLGDALEGVDTVYVLVEITAPDSARPGLSQRVLQDSVEHGLRRFGITISEDVHAHLRVELLLLEPHDATGGAGYWMWVLTIGFFEPVVPRRYVEDFAEHSTELAMDEEAAREGVRFLALNGIYGSTWSETEVGVSSREQVGTAVMESLHGLIVKFLREFLDAANVVWMVEVKNVAPYAIDVVVGDVTMEVVAGATVSLPVTSQERPEVRVRCPGPGECPDWFSWVGRIEVSVSRASLP